MAKRYSFAIELTQRQRDRFADRLLRLRQVLLDTDIPYNQTSYLENDDGELQVTYNRRPPPTVSCGTSACALGHAALYKGQFPGLKLEFKVHKWGNASLLPTDTSDAWFGECEDEQTYADRYFGPTAYENLFSYDSNGRPHQAAETITAKQAAAGIEKFVRERYGYEPA